MTSKMQLGETILLQDKTFGIFRRVALIYLCLVILTTLSLCAPLFNSCNKRVIIQSFCTRNLVKNVNLSLTSQQIHFSWQFKQGTSSSYFKPLLQKWFAWIPCMEQTTMILNLSLSWLQISLDRVCTVQLWH